MNQSAFAIEVLGMLGNDYEAPKTLASDLARELGRDVSEAEVRAVLENLALRGLAQAFVFEPSTGRYVPIEAAEVKGQESPWFNATPEGMAAYDTAS